MPKGLSCKFRNTLNDKFSLTNWERMLRSIACFVWYVDATYKMRIYIYETHLAKDIPEVFLEHFLPKGIKVAKKVHVFKYEGKPNSACAVID